MDKNTLERLKTLLLLDLRMSESQSKENASDSQAKINSFMLKVKTDLINRLDAAQEEDGFWRIPPGIHMNLEK